MPVMTGFCCKQKASIVCFLMLGIIGGPIAEAQLLQEEQSPSGGSIWLRMPESRVGHTIASQFVDAFVTTEQVDRVHEFLCEPSVFNWTDETSLFDIQRDLGRHLPVCLDLRALEDVGLTGDTKPMPDLHPATPAAVLSTSGPFERPNPFADTDDLGTDQVAGPRRDSKTQHENEPIAQNNRGQHAIGSFPSSRTVTVKWWSKAHSEPLRGSVVTNGGRLFQFLSRVDLTLNLANGLLKITTVEQAEEVCCVCVYDVTSLVPKQDPRGVNQRSRFGSLGNFRKELELSEVIEMTVQPDTWESLGGPSTIVSFRGERRHWLIVRAPLLIQWKVHGVLDCLNH